MILFETLRARVYRFEFYLPMVFTVGAILMEKMGGLLERSLVAGDYIMCFTIYRKYRRQD